MNRKVTVPINMPDKGLSLKGETMDAHEYSTGLPSWHEC